MRTQGMVTYGQIVVDDDDDDNDNVNLEEVHNSTRNWKRDWEVVVEPDVVEARDEGQGRNSCRLNECVFFSMRLRRRLKEK